MNLVIKAGMLSFGITVCAVYLAAQPVSEAMPAGVPRGTLTTWGEHESAVPIPVTLPPGVTVLDIASGENGNLAITTDGVYGWDGLGSGHTTSETPAKVYFPPTVTSFKALAVGFFHSVALTDDGVYAWGANSYGQLGDGTTVARSVPGKVIFPPAVTAVTAIAAGYWHSLAITNDGLYAWGSNSTGEVGDGSHLDRTLPVKVVFPSTVTTVTAIAAGQNDSFAVTNDLAYAWGDENSGRLGDGSFGGSGILGQPLPVRILFGPEVTKVRQIAAGEHFALAITDSGVFGWGENLTGTLGNGTLKGTALPVKVKFPPAVVFVRNIAASRVHALAVTNFGLYAWGDNSAGQLGFAGPSRRLVPTRVAGEGNAIKVAAEEYHSLALH